MLISDIKNTFNYITAREWRELAYRIYAYFGKIDLKNDSHLVLPTENAYPYSNTGGLPLIKVLKFLNITPDDSIVDFGCGKGGALISFSSFPFAKVSGVEIKPELVKIAQRNLDILKIRRIGMTVCDATEFTDYKEYNYFYFANPFPANILFQVIRNIESSLVEKPRKITLIYYYPMSHDEILKCPSFHKIKEFGHCPECFFLYSTANEDNYSDYKQPYKSTKKFQ